MSDRFPQVHSRTRLVLQTRADIVHKHVLRVIDAKTSYTNELEALANTVLTFINRTTSKQRPTSIPVQRIEQQLIEDIKDSALTTNEALVMLGEMITSVSSRAVANERETQ